MTYQQLFISHLSASTHCCKECYFLNNILISEILTILKYLKFRLLMKSFIPQTFWPALLQF